MRVLFLTYYFPPDRVLAPFVHRRLYLRWKNSLVIVINWMSFVHTQTDMRLMKARLNLKNGGENDDPPIAVPKHQSDMFGQSIAFVRFVAG